MKAIAVLLTLVLCLGCQKKPEPHEALQHFDPGLRTFLGIRNLTSELQLPPGTAAYFPAVLFFAEGKALGVRNGPAMIGFDTTAEKPWKIRMELMWQFEEKQIVNAALVDGLNRLELLEEYPFWNELNSAGWRNIPLEQAIQYEGYHITGLLVSSRNKSQQLYPEADGLA